MRFRWLMATVILISAMNTVSAQESTREDFNEYCLAMEGRWISQMTVLIDGAMGKKGDTIAAYGEGTLTADGNAILGTLYGGDGMLKWITVFDPGSKQIKRNAVSSEGAVWTMVVRKEGDGKWCGSSNGYRGDGTKITGESTLTITDGGDTHTWTTEVSLNGEKQGQRTNVWRRVSN